MIRWRGSVKRARYVKFICQENTVAFCLDIEGNVAVTSGLKLIGSRM